MTKTKTKKSSVAAYPLPPNEKKWRAESDACTLAEAAAIKRDPGRFKEATKAARSLVAEKENRAKNAVAEARAIKTLAKKG